MNQTTSYDTADGLSNLAPAPRDPAEVEALLGTSLEASRPDDDDQPLRTLLVAGPKDHGPGEHDYPWFQAMWADLLREDQAVEIDCAAPWPSPEQWQAAELVVCYFWCHNWNDAKYDELERFLERGGGLICLHAAVIDNHDPERLAKHIGLGGQRPQLQYRHGPLTLDFSSGPELGIGRGFDRLELVDESYWLFHGDPQDVDVLATAVEEGKRYPQIWTFEPGAGRVLCFAQGHYRWTFIDPLFRILLLRGMAWTTRRPLDRFVHLATRGATAADLPECNPTRPASES